MDWITQPQAWVAFITLTALEIVLGIDNIIFISILTSWLRGKQRKRARSYGLALAMISRIALLFSLTWIMRLTAPLFFILKEDFSGRDLILLAGGLFLFGKSTLEIHKTLEGAEKEHKKPKSVSFMGILAQIMILDVVFSLDSVITAVGLAQHVGVMISAIIIAILVMMISVNAISDFVDAHPTIKMLALSFLILIGVSLVAEGLNFSIPKGYIYFAMAFSFGVEMLNLKIRKSQTNPTA